jgi:hypothetical protein
MHRLWRSCGSPRGGVINAARLKAKLDYKQAIRISEQDFEKAHANKLHSFYVTKDNKNFWKSWSKKYMKKGSSADFVGNCSDPLDIAEKFREFYASVYVDSACDESAVSDFNGLLRDYNNVRTAEVLYDIDICQIEKCVHSLKPLKSAGHDGIVSEHLVNCHPAIYTHLKMLFGLMLRHCFVPDSFGIGIVIPLIKDRNGDTNSIDNYRPITLSPIISKVFENFIIDNYAQYFGTDPLQFGPWM